MTYVLGHSDHELARLARQAMLLAPVTRAYFEEAGLAAGMRVLDVGSGGGDVAFLARDIVGETGAVVGTDTSATAIAAASANATARELGNVTFVEGDPAQWPQLEDFDAVIGRYVLIFQPDPAAMLRQLGRVLRPGGIIAFHEPDWRFARSFPSLPSYDACCSWIRETTERVGRPWASLDRLGKAFLDAGLGTPTMRLQTYVGVGDRAETWLRALVDIVTTLLPVIESTGVATAAEVGLETLLDRMLKDVRAANATVVGRTEVGAWCGITPSSVRT